MKGFMKELKIVAYPLGIVGAVNWGLVGAIGLDLVDKLLGQWAIAVKVVYIAVGVSGLYIAYDYFS